MSKKNKQFRVIQGGEPGVVRAPSPPMPPGMTAEDLARLKAGATGPMGAPPMAKARIDIEEADFLRFRLTKEWEANLQLKEKELEEHRRRYESEKRNLASMEETIRAREETMVNFRQLVQLRIANIYNEIGIEPGDEIKNIDGESFIERPIPNKPVDYKVTRKNGKEVLTPILPDKGSAKGTAEMPAEGSPSTPEGDMVPEPLK